MRLVRKMKRARRSYVGGRGIREKYCLGCNLV